MKNNSVKEVKTIDFWDNEDYTALTKEDYEEDFTFTERIPFHRVKEMYKTDGGNGELRLVTVTGRTIWYTNCFGTWRK